MHLGELDFHLDYCFEFSPTNRWFIVALAVSFLPG
jgi:hypothetical protein